MNNPISHLKQNARERELLNLAFDSVGIKNDNTGSAIKMWIGTMAEYEAIANPDEGTLYMIKADEV